MFAKHNKPDYIDYVLVSPPSQLTMSLVESKNILRESGLGLFDFASLVFCPFVVGWSSYALWGRTFEARVRIWSERARRFFFGWMAAGGPG